MHRSDEDLYRAYLEERDEQAFAELFTRYRESLTMFLTGFIHNPSDAEDLMIEAFAVAASGTARFGGKSSFKTWLYAIGHKKAVSYLRKQHIRQLYIHSDAPAEADDGAPPVPELPAAPSSSPEHSLLSAERRKLLHLALDSINAEYRQALYLTYFEEMDTSEIALVINKSIKQVYNLVFRGKQALRTELDKLGYEWEVGEDY